jgi:hypothetical protein
MRRTLTRASIVLSYLLFANMVAANWVVIHGFHNDLIISRVLRNNAGVSFLALSLTLQNASFNNSQKNIYIQHWVLLKYSWINLSYIQKYISLCNSVVSQRPLCNLMGKRRGSPQALQPVLPLPAPIQNRKEVMAQR